MRTVSNKSVGGRENTIFPLEEIRTRSAEAKADYSAKEEATRANIKAAEEAIRTAEETKRTTVDESEYRAAETAEKEATDKAAFYARLLENLKFAPHMDEDEYDKAVETCVKIAENARDSFRRTVDDHFSRLQAGRDEYETIIGDVNRTLNQLDAEANVLQSRHRYRKSTRIKAPTQLIEDPNEWKNHKIRFDPFEYLFTAKKASNTHDNITEKIAAAWRATNRR